MDGPLTIITETVTVLIIKTVACMLHLPGEYGIKPIELALLISFYTGDLRKTSEGSSALYLSGGTG
jgi:hypothetical protein